MTVKEALEKRQSIRNFTKEPVSQELLETVIEAGRLAPFAGLAQAGKKDFRHFFVIRQDSEAAKQLMDLVAAARMADLAEVVEMHLENTYPAYANAVKNMSGKPPAD